MSKPLVLAAAYLARSAPEQWAQFIAALETHAAERRDEVLSAPSKMLKVAQGRALALRDLQTTLVGARATAEKIENKNQQPRQPL